MTSRIITVLCGGPGLVLPTATHDVIEIDNRDNHLTPCEAYQHGLAQHPTSPYDILVYAHDDVTIGDQLWLHRIEACLGKNPNAVCVGFGGATSLGRPNLYKQPYRIENMARGGFVSNLTDWQVHGGLETGVKRVAVVDAFLMAVRRDFLMSVGGWPVKYLSHHCLDLWLACEAARHGKEVYMVGVNCTHHGGGTSTKEVYRNAAWLQGGSLERDHQEPHHWLYENYKDVLPICVA